MSHGTPKCSTCNERGISKKAIKWCSECDEKLCFECSDHHSSYKLTKQHETRTIEEYLTLPPFILDLKQFCEEHDEKYQVFCKTHDCPCCRRCGLEKHKDCREIVALEDITHNVKTSVSFQDLQQQLEEMAGNIAKISNDRQESMTSIAQQKKKIEDNIFSIRQKINDHLDKLQEKLIKELVETEAQSNKQIQKVLGALQKKENEIKDLQSNMVNIRKYASDLQAYLSIKQIGASTIKYENYIQSLADDKRITRTSISCKLDDAILNISSNIKSFGEIKIDVQPGTIKIGINKHKQAQMMIPKVQSSPIVKASAQLLKQVKIESINIRGCCFLPDGKMVLASFEAQKLLILNKDGSADFTIDFPRPRDVVCIDDDTVAVTSNYVKGHIGIVSLKKKIIEKKINVSGPVCGITHKDGALFYCSTEKGLLRTSLRDSTSVSIVGPPLPDWSYLTIHNDNIFYTADDKVICCDMEGQKKWNLNLESRPLFGITVDKEGNVFVVGPSKVFAISPDGKHYKNIISGMYDLQVLNYDKASRILLIATRTEQQFLYKIENL